MEGRMANLILDMFALRERANGSRIEALGLSFVDVFTPGNWGKGAKPGHGVQNSSSTLNQSCNLFSKQVPALRMTRVII